MRLLLSGESDRMKLLVRERSELTAELEASPAAENVVALHPATLARYEQQLARPQEALGKGVREGDSEAAEAIRDLVETVTVYRDLSKPGGVEVEIAGRLTALLGEADLPNGVKGVWGKMAAEERYRLSPHHPNLRCRLRSCA
jgi:site-specific DNA recombinase